MRVDPPRGVHGAGRADRHNALKSKVGETVLFIHAQATATAGRI
jgi:hypothetical protein